MEFYLFILFSLLAFGTTSAQLTEALGDLLCAGHKASGGEADFRVGGGNPTGAPLWATFAVVGNGSGNGRNLLQNLYYGQLLIVYCFSLHTLAESITGLD